MAVANAYTNLNMINPGVWNGYRQEATSNRFVISDGNVTAVYEGYGLRYNNQGSIIGGTFTSFRQFNGNDLAGEFYEFAFPATLAADFINNNDIPGLFDVLFGGNDKIYGSVGADRLAGYRGDDYIYANGGDDYVLAGEGNDVVYLKAGNTVTDGGSGFDWAVLEGAGAEYNYNRISGGVTFSNGSRGVDADVYNVERVVFDDGVLAFDTAGNAGQMYRLYQAAFDRDPDAEGLGYWIGRVDSGTTDLEAIADSFLYSPEFERVYGRQSQVSNGDFVELLYLNALGRNLDQSGYDYWVGKLNTGQTNRGDLLAFFAESDENKAQTTGEISDGIWYI